MNRPDHPFWIFSLELYSRAGVADSCVALQDDYGADVNVLLYCCWLGHTAARSLTRAEIRSILAAAEAWQAEVVTPVRGIRRRLKSGFEHVERGLSDGLRQSVQALEIESEKIEQLSLATMIPLAGAHDPDLSQRAQAALTNLRSYFAALNRNYPEADAKVLIAACFPDIDERRLERLMAGTRDH